MKRWARLVPHHMTDQNGHTIEKNDNQVWVFGILKKQLLSLKVTILQTRNFMGDWGFLMSMEDAERVKKTFPEPHYKDGIVEWVKNEF